MNKRKGNWLVLQERALEGNQDESWERWKIHEGKEKKKYPFALGVFGPHLLN